MRFWARLTLDGHLAGFDKCLSRLLMRVGSVPQCHPLDLYSRTSLGTLLDSDTRVHFPKVVRDSLIVAFRAFERLERQSPLGFVRDFTALFPFFEYNIVVARRGDDGYSRVVLGSGSKKGDTSNVDLLDSGLERTVGLGSLVNKGVEVAYDESDGRDVVGREVGQVGVDLSR